MKLYPYYIACAELSTRTSETNAHCMKQAVAIATTLGVPYEVVTGAYKGKPETSLALYGERADYAAQVIAIAFDQETYLKVYSYHSAKLLDQAGNTVMVFTQRVPGTADNHTTMGGDPPFTFI